MDGHFNYSFFLERLKKIVDLREKIFNYSSLFFFVFVLSEIIFCKKSSKYFLIYAQKIGNTMKQVACKICSFDKLSRCPDIRIY